ncbi:hypothetical protein TNCV_459991 [Trichonephila clavipes]|nr:hypothetical protein TNCV_459991 [Trichonephila clavipes]
MAATLTLSKSFVSDMDWEATEVRVEEMKWEPSYIEVSEPMDWEDIPQVRVAKRSKVSEPVVLNVSLQDQAAPSVSKKVSPSYNITLQENTPPPQHKKVSLPLEPKPNPSLQGKLTPTIPKKVSPITSEFIRHKIRCKPKVSIPHVSAPTNRVILKARRPSLPKI